MGAPLQVAAVVVRILSQLWKKPIVAVNHCVAHIEMGRIVTGADDPFVFHNLCVLQGVQYSSGFPAQCVAMHYRQGLITLVLTDWCSCISISLEKKGEQFIDLPYVVKGMDVSFSGILSYMKPLLRRSQCYERS
ncbi:hypothetical protein CMV_017456 [Castanea mollissima]|uniref:Gcp-like domain-containing protein n=1 Tax=Castanea mollissima TaxID=60419 RepID=A0A8J4VQM6_9ROSI|nr:hypothetical protein CMV_017456 [Castanea mollissima]